MDAQRCHELPKCSFSLSCQDRIPRKGPVCPSPTQHMAPVSSILAATGTWQRQIMSEAALGKYQGLLRMVAAQISPATFSCFTSSSSPLTVCSPGVGRQGEGIREQECLQARARCGADVLGPVWSSLHVAVAAWLVSWAVTKLVRFLPLSSH